MMNSITTFQRLHGSVVSEDIVDNHAVVVLDNGCKVEGWNNSSLVLCVDGYVVFDYADDYVMSSAVLGMVINLVKHLLPSC